MKLNSTLKKLPLMTLLSLGLVTSPLVVNASSGDRDRDRHEHHQPDHGRLHKIIDHQNSCRMDYKRGHKNRHHYYKPNENHSHYNRVQRHYSDDHQLARSFYLLGLFSD